MAKSNIGVVAAKLSNPDPWGRFPRGVDLARSIERGREQDALWLLSDGVEPPNELLDRGLCSAAYQGLANLCWALAAKGARARAAAPMGEAVRELAPAWSPSPSAKAWVPTHSVGMLALLGGHVALAHELDRRMGSDVFGSKSFVAMDYARMAAQTKVSTADKLKCLEFLASRTEPRELALAANFMCVSGALDEALDLLESTNPMEQARVAKAILAPLCAYAPSDPQRESALIVLERAIELCEGRQDKSIAPWAPFDFLMLENKYNSKERRRMELSKSFAERHWGWGGSSMQKTYAAWPRVAACLCLNHKALELLEIFPWSSEEVAALKGCSKMILDMLDKNPQAKALPALFASSSSYGPQLPGGFDARAAARKAESMAESMAISLVSKEAEKRMQKRQKKEFKAMDDAERLALEQRKAAEQARPKRARL